MKFLKKMLTSVWLVAAVQMVIPTNALQAQYCGYGGCGVGGGGGDCCWWLTTLLVAGAAGAGAGFAAGHNNGKHGKHGKRGKRGRTGATGDTGPQGPQGVQGPQGQQGIQGPAGPAGASSSSSSSSSSGCSSCGSGCNNNGCCPDCCDDCDCDCDTTDTTENLLPFIADEGQTLTFDINLTLAATLVSGTIIPYVSTPDGQVIEGSAFSSTLAVLQSRTIVISDPVFGTYHPGIQIINPGATVAVNILATSVTASRDGSTTDIAPPVTFGVSIGVEEQVEQSFTYGQNNVP